MLNGQACIQGKGRLKMVLDILIEVADLIPVLTTVNDQPDIGGGLP